MATDTQSRKWLLTINNPVEHGFPHDRIREELNKLKSIAYWCMADEIGNKTHTYHTHIFIYSRGGIRFSTLKKHFPPAELEMARGKNSQVVEYVTKTGKYAGTDKQDTSVEGTFEESGELPLERPGARQDMADLYDMVANGLSNYEILQQMPDALVRLDHIDRTRQIIIQERFKDIRRDLHVVYIWGPGGLGKTRYVLDKYGYSNVFRVIDYNHPFDNYRGQDVIFFDEFHSGIPINLMLQYLDGYPLELPCRYANKWACYTKVYVASNIALNKQYEYEQKEMYDTWLSFLRRIHEVDEYCHEGVQHYDMEMVRDGWHLNFKGKTPFDKG